MNEDIRDQLTYRIIGAAIDVHSFLGSGFLEAVYQEALMVEFERSAIPYKRENEIPIFYRGSKLLTRYRADFVCFDEIIVELKAIRSLSSLESAQVFNYLKATGLEKALLINFGGPSLEYKRIVKSL